MRIYPNVDDQSAALRRDYPSFAMIDRKGETAIWRGTLKPLMLTYTVTVSYRVPWVMERLDLLAMQPRVRVASPPLRLRRGDPEGALPHVYWMSPTDPVLCLFDTDTDEWTPADLLSETTVPYAIDWLGCYEGWRATGAWTGGGRHPHALPAGAI